MRRAVDSFVVALTFFTRLPVPTGIEYSEDRLRGASNFAPLIGWIVGTIAALTYLVTAMVLPSSIAVLASMITTIWVTGALHEDGFADFCDGFGGGQDARQTLSIMNDSRIGAFGAIGIGLLLLLKFTALAEVAALVEVQTRSGSPGSSYRHGLVELNSVMFVGATMIVGHTMSRFLSVSFMYTHDYVRPDEDAKAKRMSSKMTVTGLGFAAFFGVLPLALFWALGNPYVLLAVIPVFIIRPAFGRLFTRRLGGYTGDCLGAVQQVTEVVFYVSVCAVVLYLTSG